VAQARLHDSLVALHLREKTMNVGHDVLIELAEVSGDDAAEQDAAEPGRRLDRQVQVSEGETPRRGAHT